MSRVKNFWSSTKGSFLKRGGVFLSLLVFGLTGVFPQSRIQMSEGEKVKLRNRFERYQQSQQAARDSLEREEEISQADPTSSLNTLLADSARDAASGNLQGEKKDSLRFLRLGVGQRESDTKASQQLGVYEKFGATEKKRRLAKEQSKLEIKPFGYAVFESASPTFRPDIVGPVHPDFKIGPGDEIIVNIWGDMEKTFRRTIQRNGTLTLPGIGQMGVNGTTVGQLKSILIKRFSRINSGVRYGAANATTFIDVTLGRIRNIKVFVLGDVIQPGGYVISAIANAFHALYFAGGPSEKGSLRKIIIGNELVSQIKPKKGKKKKPIKNEFRELDFYEYLIHGKVIHDVPLQDGDVIFVPPVGKRVRVEGAVHREAIYELKEKETFKDLVSLFGGINARTDPGRVQISRIDSLGGDREVLDFKDPFFPKPAEWALKDGDRVYVYKRREKMEFQVKIQGFVKRPGVYEFKKGKTVQSLIALAGGIDGDAFPGRADLVRLNPDLTRELIRFNLQEVVSGKTVIKLKNKDSIRVYSRWEINQPDSIEVFGAVNIPGRYELIENMTVRDIVFMAGGFSNSAARDSAEVSRIDPSTGKLKIHKMVIDSNYLVRKGQADFKLKEFDNIFIRNNPDWELQRNVVLAGEFIKAGSYSLVKKNERLSQLLIRSGGLKETAYFEGAKFFRAKDSIGKIAIDVEKILKKKNFRGDIILMAGDSLFIPRIPKTVRVEGEVGMPTNVLFKPGAGIKYYIHHAGGYTKKAEKSNAQVILANGQVTQRSFWGNYINAGSQIIIPRKPEEEALDWVRILTVSTATVTSLGTLLLLYLASIR